MTKRNSDAEMEGPSAKMKRDDADDGGGRAGRVRKKSAKVLEMEEFEQVEKTHHSGKKGKTPKGAGATPKASAVEDDDPGPVLAPGPTPKVTKLKTPKASLATPKSTLAASLMQAPIAVTPASTAKSAKLGSSSRAQFVPVQTSGIISASAGGSENATEMLAAAIKKELHGGEPQHDAGDAGKSQSVIKYLLSSPSSGSKASLGSTESGAELVGGGGKKTASKKEKADSSNSSKAVKSKSAKVKLEMSPPGRQEAEDDVGGGSLAAAAAGLKMRISASSDPQSAQVTLNPTHVPEKVKKSSKKSKMAAAAALESPELDADVKLEMKTEEDSDEPTSPGTGKKAPKKALKKKEKLIQDAISAANKLPNLAALVVPGEEQSKLVKKKKKVKIIEGPSLGEGSPAHLYDDDDDAGEESNLVIAETEKKKKKTFKKKKSSLKDKGSSADAKAEDEKSDKKLSKRAPTAYMLFCNTHRPGIVNCNPGIEFAGISRKLGEMWQTLSTKQKLQWRRKAQRRMKKGSNLISTGKTGKDAAAAPQGAGPAMLQPAVTLPIAAQGGASGVRYINVVGRSPVETPQSPTKLNFSIEPVDVAAHLKLLGESLSIIGMRLQEHKGMIAVQGSLSVLLDSLLCACGPLLCLTQQVPDMDGCDPLVHGQTLDSVAYVMPGL